jgi:Holliday junction resolvase-like predicted endonuclease
MANDIIHDAVKKALGKDGWTIVKKHLHLEYEELDIFVNLMAERAPFVAEKDNQQILVEVKTFGIAPSCVRCNRRLVNTRFMLILWNSLVLATSYTSL